MRSTDIRILPIKKGPEKVRKRPGKGPEKAQKRPRKGPEKAQKRPGKGPEKAQKKATKPPPWQLYSDQKMRYENFKIYRETF